MRVHSAILAAVAVVAMPIISSADYFDPLTSASGASDYNVNLGDTGHTTGGAAAGSSDAMFGYDYSAAGVPLDPFQSSNSTTALRLRAGLNSSANGAVSISPKSFTLPNDGSGHFTPFILSYDIYSNFVTNGTNSTTLQTLGVGVSGTAAQFTFNPGPLAFASTIDGGTSTSDFRIYVNGTNQGFSNNLNWNYYGSYTVAQGTTTAILNNTYSASSTSTSQTVTYWIDAFGGTHNVPAAQTTIDSTQTGSTSGTTSYAWHKITVAFDGTNYIWSTDGVMLGTVPASAVTAFNTSKLNFFLGASDTNNGGDQADTSGKAATYNFVLYSDLSVVPEPTGAAILALVALPLLRRRRKSRS
jgi:MYXO-CTERM domain-containing protein